MDVRKVEDPAMTSASETCLLRENDKQFFYGTHYLLHIESGTQS